MPGSQDFLLFSFSLVFEIDQPRSQAWKRKRLVETGFGIPDCLRLVAVDFESNDSWIERLVDAGFDTSESAVVASSGVSMYLTSEAIMSTLRQVAKLASGSTLAMTFQLPLALIEQEERPGREATERFARMAGTPFISLFSAAEILHLADEAGFREVKHISAAVLDERYFSGRTDNLKPSSAEELLVASA
jgi:methyltransferase (TIGR00027 family)